MKCIDCKYFDRSKEYIDDGAIPNKYFESKIGTCGKVNYVNYWDDTNTAAVKIVAECIGGENVFVHELFGCIKYEYKFE